jgi:hypothetical protein
VEVVFVHPAAALVALGAAMPLAALLVVLSCPPSPSC